MVLTRRIVLISTILGSIILVMYIWFKVKVPCIGKGLWNIPCVSGKAVGRLETGDLIFWQSDTDISNLLSHCLQNPFTHMSIVWQGGYFHEATIVDCDVHDDKHGVHEWSLIKKAGRWTGDYVAIMKQRIPLNMKEKEHFESHGHVAHLKITGFQMDAIYALNSMFMRSQYIHDYFKRSYKYFCTEFVTEMLQHIGRMNADIPRSFLTTNDYWFRKHGLNTYYTKPLLFKTTELLTMNERSFFPINRITNNNN